MKRFVAIALGSVLFLSLIAGAAWAYNAKVWLMDDYRDGYVIGSDYGVKKSDGEGPLFCWQVTFGEVYAQSVDQSAGKSAGQSLKKNEVMSIDLPEDARAFYLGCWAAVTGEDNDSWHVAGYLDD